MGAGNQAKQRFPKALLLFLWIQGPGVARPVSHPCFVLVTHLHSAEGAGGEQRDDHRSAAVDICIPPTMMSVPHLLPSTLSLSLFYCCVYKMECSLYVYTRICLQCRRPGFCPWVRKIPYRREWQPTPVFLPGELRGQRSLVGYIPRGCKELDTTKWLTLSLLLHYV